MRLDSTHEPFYGPGETKPKGMEALQATGNLIVQKSRQHAFENFLYFYETKNDIYHGKVKKNTGNKAYNNLRRGMYSLYTNETTNEWLGTFLSFKKALSVRLQTVITNLTYKRKWLPQTSYSQLTKGSYVMNTVEITALQSP